jgi:hypothetical protein
MFIPCRRNDGSLRRLDWPAYVTLDLSFGASLHVAFECIAEETKGNAKGLEVEKMEDPGFHSLKGDNPTNVIARSL